MGIVPIDDNLLRVLDADLVELLCDRLSTGSLLQSRVGASQQLFLFLAQQAATFSTVNVLDFHLSRPSISIFGRLATVGCSYYVVFRFLHNTLLAVITTTNYELQSYFYLLCSL